MAAHRFKSHFGQCECRWCAARGPRFTGPVCPVTDEIRRRLRDFAKEHGRTWKSKLRWLWTSGKDEGLLRQARNIIGPSGLDKITSAMLATVKDDPVLDAIRDAVTDAGKVTPT